MPPHSTDDGSETTRTRRRFLLGASVATAAMAGCVGSDDTDTPADSATTESPGGDTPPESFDPASELSYGRWLTSVDDGTTFAAVDLTAVPNTSSDAVSLPDPLVAYPFVRGQAIVGAGQIRLSLAGLTRAIAPDRESASTVREVVVVDRTTVASGSFATETLDERLVAPTDETWGIEYEQTGTVSGYSRYEPATVPESFEDDPPVIAVAEDAVVVSASGGRLEQVVTAGEGERARIYETDSTVRRLLERAGSGDIVVGQIGAGGVDREASGLTPSLDPQFEPRSGEDVVASLEFEDDETVESRFALAADDLAESRRERIENTFGTGAVDGSATVDGGEDRLTASGTYDLASLGLTDGGETGSGGTGSERLSRAAAAELLSPDALAFRYEPPRSGDIGELWVAVTGPSDAATLRLETASGNATEIRPQSGPVSAGDSVAVPVDPDGDSVTVSVVDEDGAVGELTTQSVPTAELSETAASRAVPEEALSFDYEAPDAGDYGSLTVEVVADTDAATLVAQPQTAPGLFTDRVGSLTADQPLGAGTTLETAVDPDGDVVVVYASVDGATGEVARWQGPQSD
jgi:hypothetical protein